MMMTPEDALCGLPDGENDQIEVPDWPSRKALLEDAGRALGLEIDAAAVPALGRYLELVLELNRIHNLTGVKDPEEAWNVLVVQSLAFLPALLKDDPARDPVLVADVGAGAGIPSFPLRLAWPADRIVLMTAVEARGKRAEALESISLELGVDGFRVECERAEDLGRGALRETQDHAVARALGPLTEVLEYTLPLVRVGGTVLVAKSFEQIDGEMAAGRVAARILGGADPRVDLIHLAGRRTAMVEVTKISPTPRGYPRRPGLARQAPLGGAGR